MKKLTPVSRILITISSLLMISAYFVPLWQILMWAPQYPEGLEMKIWINNITGDVKIISALNHYIGMKHIEVSMFPEFSYMIYIVGALIAVGLLAAIINRKFLAIAFSILIIATGLAALVDFYIWGYEYGHNLDPTAPIVVPGMSYQPPLIGTKQLLNFTAYSGPATGGWIFLGAGVLVIGSMVFDFLKTRKQKQNMTKPLITTALLAIVLTSCTVEPEPLSFGKDACHYCKMTLMDKKFGAEIVTTKGKVYKFDDTNCLLNFYNSNELIKDQVAYLMIVDFSTPEKLIDATKAVYINSEKIKSPMASNIAAFESKSSLEKFNAEWNGTILEWAEVQNAFK